MVAIEHSFGEQFYFRHPDRRRLGSTGGTLKLTTTSPLTTNAPRPF